MKTEEPRETLNTLIQVLDRLDDQDRVRVLRTLNTYYETMARKVDVKA